MGNLPLALGRVVTCPVCRRSASLALAFVCEQCQTRWTRAEFCEKTREVIAAERSDHRRWRRLIIALESGAIFHGRTAG